MDATVIRPQKGPQETFLSSPADIVIFGGAAGGGKSYGLLLEPLRHMANPKFGAVIFRRESVEIRKQGGLWDESSGLYGLIPGTMPREQNLDWRFPSGARISFSHLEKESTKYAWKGAQIPVIGFDELTGFTKTQFFYMLSRNRTTCGVKPYIRATTNPDADSWVAEFISWWINPDTGYAIPERSGVLRWFIRRGDDLIWADSKKELLALSPGMKANEPKSVTFILSKLEDNKILMEKDPDYEANLKAQTLVERERLLHGNWKIRPAAGLYFQRSYFEVIDAAPAGLQSVRSWDLAATEQKDSNDPDWTVGLKLSRDARGIFYVEHVERFRGSPRAVETAICNMAAADGKGVRIRLPQDPGQAGKSQSSYLVTQLAGYVVRAERETGDKVARAGAASSQAEVGNIKVVRGAWNEAFFMELENFPPTKGHDDQVDALSGAINDILPPVPGAGWLAFVESEAAQAAAKTIQP